MGQTFMKPCMRGGKQHGRSSPSVCWEISLAIKQLALSTQGMHSVLHFTWSFTTPTAPLEGATSPCQSLSRSQPQFTLQIHMELYTYFHLHSELHSSLRMVNARVRVANTLHHLLFGSLNKTHIRLLLPIHNLTWKRLLCQSKSFSFVVSASPHTVLQGLMGLRRNITWWQVSHGALSALPCWGWRTLPWKSQLRVTALGIEAAADPAWGWDGDTTRPRWDSHAVWLSLAAPHGPPGLGGLLGALARRYWAAGQRQVLLPLH